VSVAFLVLVALLLLLKIVNPPRGLYMRHEAARLGGVTRDWVAIGDV